jgi:hypothetical protein
MHEATPRVTAVGMHGVMSRGEVTSLHTRTSDSATATSEMKSQLAALHQSKSDLQSENHQLHAQLKALWEEFGVSDTYNHATGKSMKHVKGDNSIGPIVNKLSFGHVKGDNSNEHMLDSHTTPVSLATNRFSALSQQQIDLTVNDMEQADTPSNPLDVQRPATPHNNPPKRMGGHVVVTSSLGRNLDPNRIWLGDKPERVFVKSMSGGKIEDAHNFLRSGNFNNASVSILIGTNNIGKGESVDACFTKYKAMVDTVLISQPSALINHRGM